ncbi:type II/IV secretion system family protein, partial [Vibrio parahaemolyticus V-223/04]
GVFQIKLG